jgi:outer membrane receptor for ferric coprogen and ferric-rhodotorulic acid
VRSEHSIAVAKDVAAVRQAGEVSGYAKVTMTKNDWGFTDGAKRKYYALNMYLEHPFDGKWQARLDYTFSRSYGNTEGQMLSTIGQTDVSKTQDGMPLRSWRMPMACCSTTARIRSRLMAPTPLHRKGWCLAGYC